MRGNKKVTDEFLVDSYLRSGNVWKTAEECGMCGQSVHERLTRLGFVKKVNVFTNEDKELLLNEYLIHRNAKKLDSLARKMGRTKNFICRKARELGLTDITRAYEPKVKKIDNTGYVAINGNKEAASRHEHRIIAERAIGRKLKKNEVVHHVDGDKTNNANNNLVIMGRDYHCWLHNASVNKKSTRFSGPTTKTSSA